MRPNQRENDEFISTKHKERANITTDIHTPVPSIQASEWMNTELWVSWINEVELYSFIELLLKYPW